MKHILLICLAGMFLVVARAQNTDIGQRGFSAYNESNTSQVTAINVGETALLKYTVKNMSTSGPSIPANTVKVIVSFPKAAGRAKPYVYNGPVSFNSGYFTWSYNPFNDVLIGTNNSDIPANAGDEDVMFNVTGNAEGTANSTLNIRQGNGVEDAIGNNYASAKITVTSAPLPAKLSMFTATSLKCDAVLNWKTISELNFNHFDVEYGTDGINFSRVATIAGKGITSGSSYTYNYNQMSGDGYYRLKMVDNNGRAYYSDIVKATTSCPGQGMISVFPNPVKTYQKLIVNIAGYTGKITGEMFDAAGQRMGVYNLINGTNEIVVSKLTAGVYMLDVIAVAPGAEIKKQTFKIVVLR